MNEKNKSARMDDLFEQVIALDGERRSAFLDQHCAADEALRYAVEARLKAYDRVDKDTEFLEPVGPNLADISPGVLHIRCPHCNNMVELLEESDLEEVKCLRCGSHLNVLHVDDEGTADRISKSFGSFQLIEKLGVGSFGSVWKARDTELQRFVAIKIPRRNNVDGSFIREARAAAQLRHPNIVSVHEIGKENDIPYIVSDYVEGETLDQWTVANSPGFKRIAQLFVKIASGLHHAHECGVVHRDLKPANIMIDAVGEPHVMDFGLAKRDAGEVTMTQDGQILGTPAYMPPEQAGGDAHEADQRSDVYSLGVMLYEQLTNELPFRGTTRMLIQQVLNDDPPGPRKLNAQIPRDLETICLKCLEKDPKHRYQNALEFCLELDRWIQNRPIHARPIRMPGKAWRWCKRNPLTASWIGATLALLAFLAIAGPLVASSQTRLAKKMSDLADEKTRLLDRSQQMVRALSGVLTNTSPDSTMREVFDDLTRDLNNVSYESPDIEASFQRGIGSAFLRFGTSGDDPKLQIKDLSLAIKALEAAEQIEKKLDVAWAPWQRHECYYERALVLEALGDYKSAIDDLTTVIRALKPHAGTGRISGKAHARRAHLLATIPDDQLRDGIQAIADATTACEISDWKDWRCLRILAEAHAEADDFERAIQWQHKSDELRGYQSDTRLAYYRAKEAYRERHGVDLTRFRNVPSEISQMSHQEIAELFYAKIADGEINTAVSLIKPDRRQTISDADIRRSWMAVVNHIQNNLFEFSTFKSKVDENIALVMIRFRATRGETDKIEFLPLYLERTPVGWLVLPGRRLPFGNKDGNGTNELSTWFEAEVSLLNGTQQKSANDHLFEEGLVEPASDAFITIESPNGSEEIDRETKFTIRWTSNTPQTPVKIEMFPMARSGKKSGGVFSVVKRTDNDGEYDFVIPRTWGWNSFQLKISTVVGNVSDESDEAFISRFRGK